MGTTQDGLAEATTAALQCGGPAGESNGSGGFDGGPSVEAMPAEAAEVFPDLEAAGRYVCFLATQGQVAGVIGPRENSRLWTRHLLNCAPVAGLIPPGQRVIDIGSGAGLPGIPIALARPDLTVRLVESQSRRVRFLLSVLDVLNLSDRVEVVHARAEACQNRFQAEAVVSRAVAGLPDLVRWGMPLTTKDGRLLCLRGERAVQELHAASELLHARRLEGFMVDASPAAWPEPVRVVVISRRERAFHVERP